LDSCLLNASRKHELTHRSYCATGISGKTDLDVPHAYTKMSIMLGKYINDLGLLVIFGSAAIVAVIALAYAAFWVFAFLVAIFF
jgi:hypothetical protein